MVNTFDASFGTWQMSFSVNKRLQICQVFRMLIKYIKCCIKVVQNRDILTDTRASCQFGLKLFWLVFCLAKKILRPFRHFGKLERQLSGHKNGWTKHYPLQIRLLQPDARLLDWSWPSNGETFKRETRGKNLAVDMWHRNLLVAS